MITLTLIALFACTLLTAVGAGERKKIGYVTQDLGNQYWVAMAEGVKERCVEMGYEATVLDTRTDPARELSNVEDLIQNGADYILCSPWDPSSGATAVEVANKAGVPIAILDVGITHGAADTFLISENYEGGRLAGKFVAEKLNNKGKVSLLESNPGNIIVALRKKGFEEVMEENGIKVVSSQPAEAQRSLGMSITQNVLQAHPDLNAIFSMSDEAALGALEAANAAGKSGDIVIVGFDGTSDALRSIRNGGLTATIAQLPHDIGVMGVNAATNYFNGRKNPETTYVPVRLITKNTLGSK